MASRAALNVRKPTLKPTISAATTNGKEVRSSPRSTDTSLREAPSSNLKKKAKAKKPRKPRNTGPKPETSWDCLPDILLEDIFSKLSIRDRYNASQVCRNWNRIFYSNYVWRTFVLGDYTLTRRKYNYYMGNQYVLDHYRTQVCFHRIGRCIRNLLITPMENFFNLYEFMTIATYFCEFFEDQPLRFLKCLDFTFACESAANQGNKSGDETVFGTGGKLLEALKRLMSNLTGLRHLSLQDLLLDKVEAKYLLDDVAYNCCETLKTLRLVNCTKESYPLFHAGVFVNLRKLTISPQHLSEDVVHLLGYTNLRDLYLLQTKHTENVTPVPAKAWKECRKMAPLLNVHLKMEGLLRTELVWQEGAMVRSVIYSSPYSNVSFASVLACTNLYCQELQTYAHIGLPRFHMSRDFHERPDSSLVLIARACPNLHTIVIRELVSTCTILLIAHECRNLRHLVVRRNALLKKFDWPHNPEWSDEFFSWLRTTSRSYELTTQEVSRLLKSRWTPLQDREFKKFLL